MIKAIFVPGNGGGRTTENWFPHVHRELESMGVNVIAADFPDPELARAKFWLPHIKELGADEHTILIGHSSGAQAAMRYAETHRILGSVLVSPCYTDLGDEKEKQSGYYDTFWNWHAIKRNQQWTLVFYSTDDPYIPPHEAHHVRDHLGAEYYEFLNRGHFHPAETFPELVEAVRSKLTLT